MPVDYDKMASQLGGSASQEDDYDNLAKSMGGAVTPQIGSVPDIKTQHAINRMAEASKFESAKSGTQTAAAGLRGVGGVLGMIPIAGPFLSGGADVAAQMVEKAGGERQTYNPLRTATEVGVGMVPSMGIARRFAAAKPLAETMMGKIGQVAGQAGINALEGAATGAAAVGATALSEGQIPETGDLATGAVFGAPIQGALGMVPALRGIHVATKKARPSQVPGKIAEAIALPPNMREGAASLRTAVPLALQHAVESGAKVETVQDLSKVSGEAISSFGKTHLNPLKEAFGGYLLSPRAVQSRMASTLKKADFVADPGLRDELRSEVLKLRELKTASEYLDYFHNLQTELNTLERAGPAARVQKYKDSSWRMKINERDALRDMLANHFDRQRARMEGTTVGALREAGDDFGSINKQYGALRTLADLSEEAANKQRNVGLRKEGVPWTSGQVAEEALGPIVLSKRRLAGKALDWMMGSNDPDTLVRKAFKDFQEYATPPRRPSQLNARGVFSMQAEDLGQQRALPAMGETGEPSIADLQHIKPVKKARKQLTSGFEGGTANPEVLESRTSHYGQPTPEWQAAEQFRTLPNVTSRPQQRMLPPASGETVLPRSSNPVQPLPGQPPLINPVPEPRKISLGGEAPPPSTYAALPSGQTGTIEGVSGDYSGIRLDQTGELKWVPTRTLSVFPNRRRSPLDPAVVEESRRRSVQGGVERSERRRKTVGEGGNLTQGDYHRYVRGERGAGDFLNTMDRTKP